MTQENLKASASCHETEPSPSRKKKTRTNSIPATQHNPQLLNPKLEFPFLVRPLLLIWNLLTLLPQQKLTPDRLHCPSTTDAEILPDGYLTMHVCHVQAAAKEQGLTPGMYVRLGKLCTRPTIARSRASNVCGLILPKFPLICMGFGRLISFPGPNYTRPGGHVSGGV